MPYLGKEDRPDDVGVAEHVVLTLKDPYHKTSLNVTTDNFLRHEDSNKAPRTRHYNDRNSAQQ